ncbi:aldo/keto reductase [Demequina sp. B12]|uniref:aldo/keto reductase n=1 Tax=Demequina sp. B12 TaxID=2992757 RepID=UPI00237B1381|nr:aldo/keto reductase [Demequina sp. B12]MDE0571897.1 aldo/keto reductase [Demequina sp. B12]
MAQIPWHELNDGHHIPGIGFGTYPMKGDECASAVKQALEAGYRLIDSAVNYGNEVEVGQGIREYLHQTGTPRSEVTVQTKLPGRHHDFEAAIGSAQESFDKLQLGAIDVLLIHWPNPLTNKFRDAWRALVELRERGVVRTIGVSNFTEEHLQIVSDDTGVVPAINQVELHPYFNQAALRTFHDEAGIVTQSWSPLGKRQAPYGEEAVVSAAQAHGVTPAQVILRWQVQLGNVPLPKSATPSRQAENLNIFNFELTAPQMAAINALTNPDGRLFGGDPTTHEEM